MTLSRLTEIPPERSVIWGRRLQIPENCYTFSRRQYPVSGSCEREERLEMHSKIISGATIAAAAVSLALAGAATPTPAAAHYVAGKAHNHCKTQKHHCKARVHCKTQKSHCKGMSSCKGK
ncbi:hypothetical protein [Methylocystis bryophila]|nr:hypothetical protein [Methylocystis bryophila]